MILYSFGNKNSTNWDLMYVSSHLDQLIIIFCCCIWTLLVRLYSEHLNLTSVFSPNVSNNHINHTQQVTNSSFFVYCVNHNQHKSLKITSSASLFTIIQLKNVGYIKPSARSERGDVIARWRHQPTANI